MAMFNSKLLVYQRVSCLIMYPKIPQNMWSQGDIRTKMN